MRSLKLLGNIEIEEFRRKYFCSEFLKPAMVKIKIIGKCNLRCPKCNYWRKERNRNSQGLSQVKVEGLIRELASLGCNNIKFSGGEVTLVPYLADVILLATDLSIRTSITSNGTLIESKLAKMYSDVGLSKITISLDSPLDYVHDRMVGKQGAYLKTIKAIGHITQYTTPALTIASVVTKLNYSSLQNMPEFLHSLGVKRWDLLALVTNHLEFSELFMDASDLVLWQNNILPVLKEECLKLGIKLINSDPFADAKYDLQDKKALTSIYKSIPCFVPWYSFLIHFDGRLVPCCSNKNVVLGNVFKSKITDILNNDKSIEFRNIMKSKNKTKNCFSCFDEINNNKNIWKEVGGLLDEKTA